MTCAPEAVVDVIAHRGGLWSGTAENTLPAFSAAAAAGVRFLETDVHVSADGVLFAAHDDDLTRIADRPETIAELSAAALDAVELTAGGRLPRLADLYAALPDAHLNIDVKADRSVGAVIRFVSGLSPADAARTRLAAFSTARLQLLRRALPGVATSLGTAEVARLRTGLLGAHHLHPAVDAVQVPISWHRLPVVTAGFVTRCHRLGLRVDVWTVNDAEQMRMLAGRGVDGIVTDVPLLAQEVLSGACRRPE